MAQVCDFQNKLNTGNGDAAAAAHTHDGSGASHSHSHDAAAEHGHTHEHLENAGELVAGHLSLCWMLTLCPPTVGCMTMIP